MADTAANHSTLQRSKKVARAWKWGGLILAIPAWGLSRQHRSGTCGTADDEPSSKRTLWARFQLFGKRVWT